MIAREGLVLLGFLGVFILGILFLVSSPQGTSNLGINFMVLAVVGYPGYLIARFVIWAIKTIAGKSCGG